MIKVSGFLGLNPAREEIIQSVESSSVGETRFHTDRDTVLPTLMFECKRLGHWSDSNKDFDLKLLLTIVTVIFIVIDAIIWVVVQPDSFRSRNL